MKLLTEKDIIKAIDAPVFHLVSETADNLGLECYVIGGYVRDLFLDRESNDIDIVVANHKTDNGQRWTNTDNIRNSILIAETLKAKIGNKAKLSVFKNFGTAQLKYQHMELEFVGARKESYSHDSRKPLVEDGTIEDDQNRRDFTINAMAICLNHDRYGELVDPFDGLHDLETKTIRTPLDPDITFSDDPLRMMRCIRFATQLNFGIDWETLDSIERNKGRIRIISYERIIEELNKIILSSKPSIGFSYLEHCGLLEIIFPELYELEGVEMRNGRAHKDNFIHTLEVLDNVASVTNQWIHDPQLKDKVLWIRWAAILHDIGKPKSKRWDNNVGWTFHNHDFIGEKMIPNIFRRMKLPLNEKMKYVEKLVGLHMRPIAIADDEVTDSAIRRLLFEAGDDIDDLMILCNADITSKNELKRQRFHHNFELVKEKLKAIEEKDRIRNMKLAVDGDEIMQLFGLTPSPEVGLLKDSMKEAILEGSIKNNHDDCVAFLQNKWKEMNQH